MDKQELKKFFDMIKIKDYRIVDVEIKPYSRARIKECFNNSFNFVSENGGRYILGYYFMNGVIPIEHAWVFHEGSHYDITLKDIGEKDLYVEVCSIDYEQLLEIVLKNKYAPSIYGYFKHIK
jgi:hypothetical protein